MEKGWDSIQKVYKKREYEFDFIRSIAIIFVVLSHLLWFANDTIVDFSLLLGVFGNVIFFFTSGYVIFLNNQIISINDGIIFLKKRFLRIFPLYWIALIYYLLPQYANNLPLILSHLFGLQLVFTQLEKRLLWFIGCITVYYLLYPLIIMKTASNKSIILRSITIFLLLLVLRTQISIFNANIFAYFPVFIFGILTSKNYNLFQRNLLQIKKISIFIVTAFFYWFIKTKPPMLHDNVQSTKIEFIQTLYVHVPKVICGIALVFVLYWIANNFRGKPHIQNLFGKCAVASYPVYLFHEFIYNSLFKWIMTSLNLETFLYTYPVVFLGLPILFSMCYCIQIGYNAIILNIFSSKITLLTKIYRREL